jgi:integrase
MSIAQARVEAARVVDRIRAGQPLKEPSSPAAVTLGHLWEAYARDVGRQQRRWHDKESRVKKWLLPRFGKTPFLAIKRSDINPVLNEIKVRSARVADQVLNDLTVLEKFYLSTDGVPDDYAMRFRGGLIPKRDKPTQRERTFNPEELRAIWLAAGEAGRFGVIIKLCLYTAQRITKILSMQWTHVTPETGEWRVPRAVGEKNVPEILPLPPQAVKLIEAQDQLGYVFPSVRGTGHMIGLSELKRNFQTQLPEMPQWGMPDFRRSARTYLAELDVPVIARLKPRLVRPREPDVAGATRSNQS